MTDSFDDAEPPDPRSLLSRMIEAAAVIAFIAAVVIWQSDDTMQAARRLLASWLDDGAARPVLVAGRPADHSQLMQIGVDGPKTPTARNPVDGSRPVTTDPSETGSIAPPVSAVAPLPEAAAKPAAAVQPTPASLPSDPRAGWVAACDGPASSFCTASQNLVGEADPTIETSWTIEKSASGLYGIWTTPTTVDVGRGMTLTIGGGQPKTIPFSSCGAHSCEIRARLAGDFIELLRRSRHVSTAIVLRGGKSVSFDFSANGLDAALGKLGV